MKLPLLYPTTMQFCIIFAVVASLVAADQAPEGDVTFAGPKLIAMVLSQAIVVLLAWAITSQTKADLSSELVPVKEVHQRLVRRCRVHLAVWLVSSICVLLCFEWPRMIAPLRISDVPLVRPLLLLLPILLPVVLSWLVLHEAESALEPNLRSHSRWQYALSQVRYFLLVPIVPVLFVVVWCDLFDYLWGEYREATWAGFVRAAPLFIVLFSFPLLLRRMWQTQSLEGGPLRDQLEQRCYELDFKKRDILVWQTQYRVMNAAVAGLLPKLRYVLLSDRLIRDLPTPQVEIVFLHEVAHAKLKHSLKLILTFGATFAAAATITTVLNERMRSSGFNASFSLSLVAFIAVIYVSMQLGGRYVRLLELEADLWAATKVQDPQQYLRAIASVASGDPDRVTWLHPSFQQRYDFLLKGLRPASTWLRNNLFAALLWQLAWVSAVSLIAAMLCDFR